MTTEFEDQDLRGAVFWGVDLRDALFRDVDFSGTRSQHVILHDVELDGFVDRLVVNGVDVTEHVRAHDPWQPLRGMLRPTTVDEVRAAWSEVERVWADTIQRAWTLPADRRRERVDDEWSFVETLRHLVFAIDKWFTLPLAGGTFDAIGMPNSGSVDFPWPGLEPTADPTDDEALAAWRRRTQAIRRALDDLTDADLGREVDVLENGTVTVLDCWHTVLEEHFEHRRYALRDLARLG
ncbi:MAG: DinB family protein [Acidimicrobiia bacterium]